MKILILANNDIGLYNFRKELLEELVKQKYTIYISLPNGKKIKALEQIGCKFIETDIDRRGTNPIKDLKLILKYNRIIKNIKPEIVLTYTIKPNIYGGLSCRIKRIPYIANVTGLGSMFQKNGILSKILVVMYRKALRKSQKVFIQNIENKKILIEKNIIKEEQCKLIPGSGVNLERFCKEDYPDDKTLKFLFIGRIMKEKGVGEYLETAKVIKEKYPNTEFHILGRFEEEEYKEKIERLQEKNIIIYHGLVPDSKPYIAQSHCTILPSYHEGKSNVLLETAATGRPIITTNVAGCEEIVEDEKTGFIARVKDTKDLIEKVEKFIKFSNEQRKIMGELGRKKMENEYDRNIVIDAYLKEINNI